MNFSKLRLPWTRQLNQVGEAGLGSNPDFQLLRYFNGASLFAFVVAAVLLSYVFRWLAIDGLVDGYEREHVNHAHIIANELWDDDIEPLVLGLAGKSAAELKAAPQIYVLHGKVMNLLRGSKVFKIKVYDLKGVTIYSTELKQIGEDKSHNAGVLAGLGGLTSSKLTHQNQVSTFEGEVQDRDLVESYVPRHDPASGKVIGVFEIYSDATSLLAEIGRRQRTMVFFVVALLGVLYLTLSMIVRRAQKLIIKECREREAAQRALALSEERWKFALEGAGDGVWDRNLQTGELEVSRRYREIYGLPDDEPTSSREPWEARVHPDDLARVVADREAYFAGKTPTYTNERRMRRHDGSWRWILSRGMVVARDAQGQPLRMIGTHSDITERKAMEQRLQEMAHFDVLTGLPNRALFSDRLQQNIAKARRDKTRLALMFIDLDNFKPVNDELGHHVGDALLQQVARRMLACLRRESDTVGRVGGDEFVVMLPEVETVQHAMLVAQSIRHSLHQPFQLGEHCVHISSSIGIAMFPEHGADENLLLKSADDAMYEAKASGRNRVVVAQGAPFNP